MVDFIWGSTITIIIPSFPKAPEQCQWNDVSQFVFIEGDDSRNSCSCSDFISILHFQPIAPFNTYDIPPMALE
jgi:hypothetical protein